MLECKKTLTPFWPVLLNRQFCPEHRTHQVSPSTDRAPWQLLPSRPEKCQPRRATAAETFTAKDPLQTRTFVKQEEKQLAGVVQRNCLQEKETGSLPSTLRRLRVWLESCIYVPPKLLSWSVQPFGVCFTPFFRVCVLRVLALCGVVIRGGHPSN